MMMNSDGYDDDNDEYDHEDAYSDDHHDSQTIAMHRLARSALSVPKGASSDAIIVHNGRKLTVPLSTVPALQPDGELLLLLYSDVSHHHHLSSSPSSSSSMADLDLLSKLEKSRLTDKIAAMMMILDAPPNGTHIPVEQYAYSSDILQRLASYCGLYSTHSTSTGRRFDVGAMVERQQQLLTHTGSSSSTYSSSMVYVLEPPVDSYAPAIGEDQLLQIHFIIDPLSLAGQRASALIHLFHQQLQYVQTIVFTPRMDITDFPLQNFYRYVLSSSSSSSSSSSPSSSEGRVAVARFTHLPEQHTLTVRVDIPEPWNVQVSNILAPLSGVI